MVDKPYTDYVISVSIPIDVHESIRMDLFAYVADAVDNFEGSYGSERGWDVVVSGGPVTYDDWEN